MAESHRKVEEDLARSGLTLQDFGGRILQDPERAALNLGREIEGYVIPYYDVEGRILSFYRARLFDCRVRYKQLPHTANHIYFPKNWILPARDRKWVLFVEGEKKALAATKHGLPAVAVGGVYSWRNKTIVLPKDVADVGQIINQGVSFRIPAGQELQAGSMGPFALGLKEFITVCKYYHITILICFDTDTAEGIKPEVQEAAASLGFELRYRGLRFNKVKQLILPIAKSKDINASTPDKTALDDLLNDVGGEYVLGLINQTLTSKENTFPVHPNTNDYVNRNLGKNHSRRNLQSLSTAIVSDLDCRGARLRDRGTNRLHYFHKEELRLINLSGLNTPKHFIPDSPVGRLLYSQYNVTVNDNQLLGVLSTQLHSDEPIEEVTHHRVIAMPGSNSADEDTCRYQLTDEKYCKISSRGIEIVNNGHEGYLFEADDDNNRLGSKAD